MQPFTRQFITTLVLLLVFLAAALTAQVWLQRETQRIQAEVVAAKRALGTLALSRNRASARS